MGKIWRSFFAGFVVGITHEDVVPLFLVILPLQTRGKAFDLMIFGVARVLEVKAQDLRFPMIESVLVDIL